MKKIVVLLAIVLVVAAGCESFSGFGGSKDTNKQKVEQPNVQYFTFSDIPFPSEMTVNRDKTFIYETAAIKAGVLTISGNVDLSSLENYFRVNMDKNGWRFVNSYKYGNIVMNFTKDDRSANITITRETFTTTAEIRVGPMEKGAGPSVPSGTIMPKANGLR